MFSPIIFSSRALCNKCNNEAIEIYDYFGNPMGYKGVLDRKKNGLSHGLDRKAIYEMKCRSCGKKYHIIWEDGFPFPDFRNIPLSKQFINEFERGV